MIPGLALPGGGITVSVKHMTSLAAVVGGGAIIASVVLDLAHPADASSRTVAGGSGDSAIGTTFVSPVVPTMTLGATVATKRLPSTSPLPATTLATSFASPNVKAAPAPTCVNNGQCP
jgi:hypothetical protein